MHDDESKLKSQITAQHDMWHDQIVLLLLALVLQDST